MMLHFIYLLPLPLLSVSAYAPVRNRDWQSGKDEFNPTRFNTKPER